MAMISIITVVYNGENTIEPTIKSVLNQDFNDYEYIIIDGNSKDGTINILQQYTEKFENKNINYEIVSESDRGIYDAMNKGIKKASGEWLYFLNSGDSLYNHEVLTNISKKLKDTKAHIVYGDICSVKQNKEYIMKSQKEVHDIEKHSVFCHQAAFINSQVHKSDLYNLDYSLASDYDFFLNQYRKGEKFEYIEHVIAKFSLEGVSNKNRKKLFLEYNDIWKKHGIYPSGIKGKMKFVWGYVKISIAGLIPEKLVYFIMNIRINGGIR